MKKCSQIILWILVGISMINIFTGCGFGAFDNLLKAIRVQDVEKVRQILAENPNMNLNKDERYHFGDIIGEQSRYPPLHRACYLGNYEIAEMLLQAGADPEFESWRSKAIPLDFSLSGNTAKNLKISKMILDRSEDITESIRKPKDRRYDFIHALYFTGAKDLAKEKESLEFFQYLVGRGVEFDESELLRTAILFDHALTVEYALDELHYDINRVIKKQIFPDYFMDATPLIMAAAIDFCHDIVKILLDRDADLTYVDKFGKTALDYAYEKENQEAIDLILAKMDEISKRNNK